MVRCKVECYGFFCGDIESITHFDGEFKTPVNQLESTREVAAIVHWADNAFVAIVCVKHQDVDYMSEANCFICKNDTHWKSLN